MACAAMSNQNRPPLGGSQPRWRTPGNAKVSASGASRHESNDPRRGRASRGDGRCRHRQHFLERRIPGPAVRVNAICPGGMLGNWTSKILSKEFYFGGFPGVLVPIRLRRPMPRSIDLDQVRRVPFVFVFPIKKSMKRRKAVNLARFLGASLGTTPLVLMVAASCPALAQQRRCGGLSQQNHANCRRLRGREWPFQSRGA